MRVKEEEQYKKNCLLNNNNNRIEYYGNNKRLKKSLSQKDSLYIKIIYIIQYLVYDASE